MPQKRTRRLAAVWFADLVGYTELSGRDEEGALSVVDELQRLAREEVESRGGRIVKFVGDAVLTVFDSTDAALQSALALQESFSASEVVQRKACGLRIGVHLGEVVEAEDGDVYGDGVNLASRIEGVAGAGQVAVSEDVYRQVRGRTEFASRKIGEQSLKGVDGPVVVYLIRRQTALMTDDSSALDPITRLNAALEGRYRILSELGQGGMATVYLADDIKHERKVAVKVLKPELAAVVGAERFLAEIKTTANLQHPHILPLFDSGEADTFLFYVMPYVEGESLHDRLDRERQLSVDEAVSIASKVAGALQAAHDQGVIHRDIKPANILLSRGEPLVADFGIALAVGSAAGNRLTETGLSVGTPYYMSPEQATGDQVVGPPSDIYSLACVLYEMLVGEPPYTGRTAQAVLAKVLQGELAPASGQRRSIPLNVDHAMKKGLEGVPADRFARPALFSDALADPSFRYAESAETESTVGEGVGARHWRTVAAALAVVAAGSLYLGTLGVGSPEPEPVIRMFMDFPRGEQPMRERVATFAISGDGSRFVYQGPGDPHQLWIKRRGTLHGQPIQGTDRASYPVFSPDDTEIAFIQDGDLKRMDVGGGSSITVAENVNTDLPGAAWLDDGTFVFADPSWFLRRTSTSGASADIVVRSTDELFEGREGFTWPVPLPDARGVLFAGCGVTCDGVDVFVLDLESGDARRLVQDSGKAWYVETGHLVYVRTDGRMYAAPFDLETLQITGDPVVIMEGVNIWYGAGADVVMSDTGDLVYLYSGAGEDLRSLVWVTPDGAEEPLGGGWEARLVSTALSPDGQTVAVDIDDGRRIDIWTKPVAGGPPSRLTLEGPINKSAFWHPDETTVSFLSDRSSAGNFDVWSKPVDGTGNAQSVLNLGSSIHEAVWSPDGEWLVVRVTEGEAGDLYAIRPSADTARTPVATGPGDQRNPAVSPNGRWVAYAQDLGTTEVYVRPFLDASRAARQISVAGGDHPQWSQDGETLFYRDADRDVVAVEVAFEPALFLGAATALVPGGIGYEYSPAVTQFAVSPDGDRVLMVKPTGVINLGAGGRGRFVYVHNWLEELRELVGGS